MRRRAFLRGALASSTALAGYIDVGCAPSTQVVREGAADVGDVEHPLAGLIDMAGQPMAPPDLHNSVAIVDFWASWCMPCRQAFRYMDQLFRTYQGDGLKLVAVSIDDDLAAARRFWASARPRFVVAWDGGGEVRERFSVLTLPTTILFDADGAVVHRTEGFDVVEHRILDEHVHRLLRGLQG